MKKILSLFAITTVILLCFSCSNNSGKHISNGIDTSKYFITYEKNGIVFLMDKKLEDSLGFYGGAQIDPQVAVDMMSSHIANDVNAGTGYLNNTVSRSVTFDMTFLSAVLAKYKHESRQPDSLTIYFGKYPSTAAEYANKTSIILVGIQGGNEIYDRANTNLHPVNIGTLCPPDCVPVGDISNKNDGKVFMKYACEQAGAARGWQ